MIDFDAKLRSIHPYAAYSVSDMHWVTIPPHLPQHSVADFDPAVIAQAKAVAAEARAILRLPEPLRTREATALWDRIRAGRSTAFGPGGEGWTDPGNITEKWLAYAPRHLLDQVKELALAPKTAAAGPLYHGTRYVLSPGEILEGGAKPANNPGAGRYEHVYMARTPAAAHAAGSLAYDEHGYQRGAPNVYEVEPLDPPERDPYTDGAVRSRRVRVVRQVDPVNPPCSRCGKPLGDEDVEFGASEHLGCEPQVKTAAWDHSGSDHSGVYLRFGDWPHDERSFSPAGGYHEDGVSVYDLDREGEPSIDHGLDRGHVHEPGYCDVDEDGHCQNEDPWGEPDNDPREEMQGRKARAEKGRYYGGDRRDSVGHLVRGEMTGVGYDGEPLLKNVRRVGDWIDHRHLFIDTAGAHRLARDPSDEDYEEPEEKPPYGYRNRTASLESAPSWADEPPGDIDEGTATYGQMDIEHPDDTPWHDEEAMSHGRFEHGQVRPDADLSTVQSWLTKENLDHLDQHRDKLYDEDGPVEILRDHATGRDIVLNGNHKLTVARERGLTRPLPAKYVHVNEGSRTAAAQNPPCRYCDEPLDDEDVRDGHSAHEECSDMRWCEPHQDYHDDPAEAEGHNDTYTDWGSYLPFEGGMHRGITVRLPGGMHQVVHDSSLPGAERARALKAHLDEGGHYGVHWTDHLPIAQAWGSGEGALFSGVDPKDPEHTHVVLHAASPAEEQIEDDPEKLADRNMWGFGHDRSEREIPIREGAPVHVTGISWKRGGQGEWNRHDFGHQALAVTASADELPEEQPGLYWRAHVRKLPFDAEHAYSSPVGPGYDGKPPTDVRRGYSSFSNPYHLARYMPEFFGEDSNHREVIAFHGKQAGTGTDGEPLVVPEADHSCCGQVVHDRMPWHEFERRAWDTGNTPEHIEPGPWESRPWLHEAAWDGEEDDEDEDPDRYVYCDQGHEHWGAKGAAGLLVRHDGKYLLQKRSPYVQHGNTWSTPGGALQHGETPEEGAVREAGEEGMHLPEGTRHSHTFTDDHGGWAYHTVVMDAPHEFHPGGEENWESEGHGWFTPAEMKDLPLHPGFAASWDKVRKSAAVAKTADRDFKYPWMQWSGDQPHKAVINRAQESFREEHPEFTQPLDGRYQEDPEESYFMRNLDSHTGTQAMRKILRAAGHPGADRAWVGPHPDPKGSSQVAVDSKTGALGAVLLPHRWDLGTVAHESAHLVHAHESGIDLAAMAHGEREGGEIDTGVPDHVMHGPEFSRHLANALDVLSPGAGDDFLRHRQVAVATVGNVRARFHKLPKEFEGGDPIRREASAEDYRQPHQGPDADDGEALHELGSRGFFPPDVYDRPHDYGGDPATWQKMRDAKGDPERRVVMYRAMPAPHHKINPGDWVTLSKDYALEHAQESDGDHYAVLKKQVRAKDLRNDGNDLHEWTYHGPVQHFPGLEYRGGATNGWRNLRALQKAQESDQPQEWKDADAETARQDRAVDRSRKRDENAAMVYLHVPPGTLHAPQGGEAHHHVTLAYLPKGMSDEDFERVSGHVRDIAARHAPFKGTFGGTGTFPEGADRIQKRTAYVPLHAPAAHALHADLAHLSRARYGEFTPHATMAYLRPGDRNPEPHPEVAVPFTHVHVRRGDEVRSYPLSGPSPREAAAHTPAVLYHVSPRSNRKSIQENGLLAEYAHGPESVYLHEVPGTGAKRGYDTWRVDAQGLDVMPDPHDMCKDSRCEFRGEGSWYTDDDVPAERLTLHGQQPKQAATGYTDLKPRSGMIYLDLPPGTVRPVPGGVDDHHITLVYLGSDVTDDAFEEACRRTREAAAKLAPMDGVLRGIDIFPPSGSSKGKVPAFVPAYVGSVGLLRRALEDLSASEHKDWRPHVTLAYMEEGDSLPAPHPAVPVRFDRVHVKRGDDVVSFPLTGRGGASG